MRCDVPQKLETVDKNFLLAVRFFKLCTVGYIVAAACDFMKLGQNELDKPYKEVSDTVKTEKLEEVANHILDLEWIDLHKITSQELYVNNLVTLFYHKTP
jgi:hypothetical protein